MVSKQIDVAKACEDDYRDLWARIIERHRKENGVADRERVAERARRFRETDVVIKETLVSKVTGGRNLPKNLDAVVAVAKAYGAREEEVKVLMAWASALTAFENDQAQLGELYRNMFEPLFREGAMTESLITPKKVGYQVLRDLAETRPQLNDEIIQDILDELPEHFEGADDRILRGQFDMEARMYGISMEDVHKAIDAYKRIVAVDFDSPFVNDIHHKAVQLGRCKEAKKWDVIRYLTVSRLIINKDKTVRDPPQPGFEFLFLDAGSGTFSLGGLRVQLRENGRKLIAYRPKNKHSFTAGPRGATVFVINYLNTQERTKHRKGPKPAQDIVNAAEVGEPFKWCNGK